jgi:hypothetical protein
VAVVIGVVEKRGRAGTAARVGDLEQLPRRTVESPAPAPNQIKAPVVPSPLAVRVRPGAVSLTVGEVREVALDVQWNGYQGPLAVRLDGPPELRVSPAGPLTLRPGEPVPKLTLRLMGEPGGTAPALTVTATPAH